QDSINSQGLLHTAHDRINGLMNDVLNERLNSLRMRQMLTQAWQDERRARQDADANADDLRDMVCENIYEKCWWRRRYTGCVQQAHYLRGYYQNTIGLLEYNRDRVHDRYLKWKAKELNSRQIIQNLQNNPPGNMDAIQDVMQ